MFGDIQVPNIMQLEDTEDRPGIMVYNTSSVKHLILDNTFSPKHIIFTINNMEDFSKIDKEKHKEDFIHILLSDKLFEEKKLEVGIALHAINTHSVKYIDKSEIEMETETIYTTDNLSIVDTIYAHIGENEEVKTQFERVLEIFNR